MEKYQIILADPPWKYDNMGNEGGLKNQYQTMETKEIINLKVKKIADKDCILFLWATFPKLKEAFKVIEGWGFKYRTCAFVWVKQNPKNDYKEPKFFYPKEKEALNIYSGIGYWTNSNAEICLFAKKGSPKRINKNVKQIILAPRGKHSVKPNRVRKRIVKLLGDLPRIELFAREKTEGWDCWGNEVKSDIKL